MSIYDYINDEAIKLRVYNRVQKIHGRQNKEDFTDSVYLELYDFMPFDRTEINLIIDRVYRKYLPDEE